MSIFLKILSSLWKWGKWLFIIPGSIYLFFCFLVCLYCFIFFLIGKRFKKSLLPGKNPVRSVFKRLFYDFPKQRALDIFNRDPDYFDPHGVIVFTGRQGQGKTISMVKQIKDYKVKYPLCSIQANLGLDMDYKQIDYWKMLLEANNGPRGVVVALDEMQNWFSSNQSKDFPPEMLEVVTQNRKNRRVILGTSQVFTRLSKPIREQVTEVRKCRTFFGCLTFVNCVEPVLDSSGEVVKFIHKRFYWFVHDEKLRSCYDTFEVVRSFLRSGFKEEEKRKW